MVNSGRRDHDASTAWQHAISLIYGEQVLDDIEFCTQHSEVIMRYSPGIMTLQGTPRETLEGVALDPMSVPGWTRSLQAHPEDSGVLQEFFARLIRFYESTGFFRRWDRIMTAYACR